MPRPCAVGTSRSKSSSVPYIGLDVEVVGDVVAVVVLRRRVARREPDGVDTELAEVVEPAR